MSELLKPVGRVLFHADCKGSEMGSAIGLALALPYAAYKGDKVSVAGAACMAGAGLGIGSGVAILVAGVKLVRMDKETIKSKGESMTIDKVDKACGAAGTVGLAMGVYRVASAAKTSESSFGSLLVSKQGAWTMLAYGALGVGIVYGAHAVAKNGKKAGEYLKVKIDQAKDKASEVSDATEEAVDAAAKLLDEGSAAVNGAVEDAAAAVEDASEAVKSTVDETVAEATK